jgi:CheY-like chemotaxis protein
MTTQTQAGLPCRPLSTSCCAAKVLVVDDDEQFRALARHLLEPGYEVSEVSSVDHCLRLLGTQPMDAVILDVVMPERDGLGALQELKQRYPQTRIVTVSGADESELYLTVSAYLGADASLNKSKIGSLSALLEVLLDR